jgi:hypothetical protein
MSLYESTHRNAASGSKAGFDYLLVYAVCFIAYLIPVAIRRFGARMSGRAQHRNSVFGETSALAANCASSSFAGL